MKSLFAKAKPYLVIAAVAIAAVYVWNTYIADKLKSDGSLQA